eukprot:7379107-Prymnesium_polylepis.4
MISDALPPLQLLIKSIDFKRSATRGHMSGWAAETKERNFRAQTGAHCMHTPVCEHNILFAFTSCLAPHLGKRMGCRLLAGWRERRFRADLDGVYLYGGRTC